MICPQPRIAIIGGGPCGLTAGLLLHRSGIPFSLFELRQKPTDEELAKPSGMLDLHDTSGILALKECGVFDEFLELTGECSEANKVLDKNGNILYKDEGENSSRPEISRHLLTRLLISHIPAKQIHWGYKLLSATRSTTSEHTKIELDFGSCGKQKFDLVIGSDGAWSKIRSLLMEVRPYYSGMHLITLTARGITKKYPHLAELVGLGSFAALGNRHGVMSQRGPQDSARIYVFLTAEDEHFATTAGLAGKSADAAKERLLSDNALLGTWAATLKELVSVACDEERADNPGGSLDIRAMYVLPDNYAWDHQTGATIIGDAAHLMRPVGEGVNLAMLDAMLLVRAIIKAHKSAGGGVASFLGALDPLVEEFEVDLVARAKKVSERSESITQMMFGGEDAATTFAEFFLRAHEGK
jgi:2-polyprenyl-6-methoxyphenol hydroxylase-like FAD-dependent oxidoreductase